MNKKALEASTQPQHQVRNFPIYEKPTLSVHRFQIDSVMQALSRAGGTDLDNSVDYNVDYND